MTFVPLKPEEHARRGAGAGRRARLLRGQRPSREGPAGAGHEERRPTPGAQPRGAMAGAGADAAASPAGAPSPGSAPHRRAIYLLPNAFTTGNLFCGFYAIVMAMKGEFWWAAVAIFVAMFLDSLDGRVARLTNSQSAFGEQYDSLADMISFGAAPALVVYSWALSGVGKLGWMAAFVYVAGAALRLARFNTNIKVVDKRFFQGLPSPSAAALVTGFVWVATAWHEAKWIDATGSDLDWLAWLITLYAGLSMVSNSPFYSFKDFNLRRAVPFMVLIVLMLAIVLVSSDPPTVLFLIFLVYSISGHATMLMRHLRRRRRVRRDEGSAD